jgi:hypothetical protein
MALSLTDTERRFRTLHTLLKSTVSARHRLYLIDEFLREIVPDFRKYRSYFAELSSDLPVFTHPLSYSGLNPVSVEQITLRFEDLLVAVPELHDYRDFSAFVLRLNELLVLLFWFIGDEDKVLHYLNKRFSIGEISNQRIILRKDGLPELLRYIRKNKHFKPSAHRFIEGVELDLRKILEVDGASLLIPVAETHNMDGIPVVYGRLRRLYASVRCITENDGRSKPVPSGTQPSGADRFRRLFNIAGVEESHWPPDDVVMSAYRSMLHRHSPELSKIRFSGELSYELNIPFHEGRSSNAAVTALLACGAQKAADERRQFAILPSVCISGEIDAEGAMLPVGVDTITQKAEAFFFSWAEALAVPVSQEPLFRSVLMGLAEKYPNRRFSLIGLSRVDDVFYDRRLTRLREVHPAVRLFEKAWKRKFEAVGTSMILVLLVVIGLLIYGPLDRNPVRGEIVGDYLELFNKYNQILDRINLGAYTGLGMANPMVERDFFTLADINGDGINEVFYFRQDGFMPNSIPELIAWSVSGDSLIWSNQLSYPLTLPNRIGQFGRIFFGHNLKSTITNSGEVVLLVALNEQRYFPSLLQKIDTRTGQVLSQYYHAGHIRTLHLHDVDGDGIEEVLIGGVNNAENSAFFAVLDLNAISGHSPLSDAYYVEGLDRAEEMGYLLIPPTKFTELSNTNILYNSMGNIFLDGEGKSVKLVLVDNHIYDSNNQNLFSFLSVEIDFDFNVLGVYTTDEWNAMMRRFYNNGWIDEIPGVEYFREYIQTFRRVR